MSLACHHDGLHDWTLNVVLPECTLTMSWQDTFIDIAKILISSQRQSIPQTYRETVTRLTTLPGFHDPLVESISQNIRLRNILAHEYLDIRFKHISRFVREAPKQYRAFVVAAKEFVSRQEEDA